MSLAAIMQPLPITVRDAASSPGAGLANLLSPNPKEAFAASSAGATTIAIDLGSVQPIDTVFLGFTNLPAGTVIELRTGDAGDVLATTIQVAHSYRRAPLRHALALLALPIAARYIRLNVAAPLPLIAGVIAAGLSIRPSEGHEWGAGRPITDTTPVDRLFDGAFGIGDGATAGGWQWTMPALTNVEVDRLYALSLDVGASTTVLVAEDADGGLGANERSHWGLLTKLEPYGRQQPGETKWAMQVQDWA